MRNYSKPFHNLLMLTDSLCHTCPASRCGVNSSRYPAAYRMVWIPACAGMTVMKWLVDADKTYLAFLPGAFGSVLGAFGSAGAALVASGPDTTTSSTKKLISGAGPSR